MNQIYIITLLATPTIGIISLNSEITFAQNETSGIEDSLLIITQLEESIKTNNNKSSYGNDNNTSIIEKILP
jgi:hypothetical protein